ncbi:MAG: LLM class flavin-dependent oxidoreductase [Candidatus Bathyarchaeia archaeon]
MVKVNFGLRVPTFPVDDSNEKEFVAQIFRFMKKLEGCFDSAWFDDHFVPWATFVSRNTPTLESFAMVSYFSGIFRKFYFGNVVLCNSYRNPALLAKMGATLQTLTGGQFILGIGAGWKEDEYIAYGYEFPPSKIRIQQLEEGVQIIRKMWTEGVANFEGRYYKVHDAYCFPKPEPIPPIMIGGGGEQLILRVVARQADWWNIPNVSPETFHHKLDILEKHCAKVGREPETIVKTLANIISIAKTEEESWKQASKSQFIQKGSEENFIVGNPDTVIEKLEKYIKIGVQHFILRFVDFPKTDGAQLFSEKVVPAFIV